MEQREPTGSPLRTESLIRRHLERDARKMFRYLRKAIPAHARGRVVNGETQPPDTLQHDEMVHIPMQDRGDAQVAQMRDLQPQRPSRKTELCCGVHESFERS